MENQHRKIKGYRELSQEEIDLMNEIKSKAAEVGELVSKLGKMHEKEADTLCLTSVRMKDDADPEAISKHIDSRYWLAAAKMDLRTGFMKLTRCVARPDFF